MTGLVASWKATGMFKWTRLLQRQANCVRSQQLPHKHSLLEFSLLRFPGQSQVVCIAVHQVPGLRGNDRPIFRRRPMAGFRAIGTPGSP